MKITLDKITLKNFKGIKSLEVTLDGRNANISGDNATGKTTVVDGFMWLMFDKDSQDKKDFNIKTINAAGEVIHGLEHSVTAVLDISGTEKEFKKVYYEKWTKQKGAADKVFTGHTTDYFIDGVPVQKKEYVEEIASIADEDTFKLITSPLYFNEQLHWSKRRELLFEVCGDISQDEVIASNEDLAGLKGILGNHDIDSYKKIIASQKKKVNDELEKVPVRINEVILGKPDLKEINFTMVANNLSDLQKQNEKHRSTIFKLQNNGGVAEKERRVAEIDNVLYKIESNAKKIVDDAVREQQRVLDDKSRELSKAERDFGDKDHKLASLRANLNHYNQAVESYRNEFKTLAAKEFEFLQESVCPTCGQAIPEYQLEETREKAIEKHNQEKSNALEFIRQKGKKAAADATEIRINIDVVVTEIEVVNALVASLKAEKETLEEAAKEPRNRSFQSDEYDKLNVEKYKLLKEIESVKSAPQDEVNHLQQSIKCNSEAMKLMQATLAKEDQAINADARVEELKQDEIRLAKEYTRLESEQNLIEEFVRAKVNMVESKINGCFKMARFKLFNTQVNGSIDECCDTTFEGVPFQDLNNAAKVNIGIDIINALQNRYEFEAPIWIDNRESINQITDTEAQVIGLVVSHDKKLKVEVN